jgi:molecular chaperone DnaK
MDIGIDLGTTHSVVGIRGQVELTPGYPAGDYLPECDVTIIPSPDGDTTFPSILWVDTENHEELLIGYAAKQKAEEGDCPLMFSKRAIGTDQKLKVCSKECTAKDAAAMILSYMKQSAEKSLGKPVERIVVTHPAYFDRNQIEETKQAAIKAGFDMSLPEQVMMEPTAAALAYLFSLEQDPVTVMTYDLGGGTFDVTILERQEGVITMKAFDGDPLLGGYNFDKALMQWMLDKASARGRKIAYDADNPEDRGRRARLLMIAERVKINLSDQRSDKVPVAVRAPDVLVDDTGKVIPIQERINREDFRALIRDDLERTVECCHRALAKAGVEPEDLDMILLVGASTFGPWVKDTLKESFDSIEIRYFEPDCCVAAGAAIQASLLPPLAHGSGIRLTLEVPKSSALPSINVSGEVSMEDGTRLADDLRADLHVYLTSADGVTLDPIEIQPNGRFLF